MEAINLNLIPNGTNPVVHCSQYDEGREFRFNLFDGSSVFVLDGTEDITCDIKKPDGNIVTAAVPNTDDDYIIVTTTLQMTACSGNSLGTINISKGGTNLYTLNFVLYCERSPLENGIESESSIHNLESMVDGMVAEDVATQYDSANVIFDATPTSGHGSPYTVTSEGIKTAIDNAFDYDNTASGSLVHITDGGDNIPLKECEITIAPDLTGYTEANLVVCGKNLLDISATETGTAWNGDSNVNRARLVISVKPNTDLYISVNGTNNLDSMYYFLSQTIIPTSMSSPIVNKAINTGDNTYIILGFNKTNIALGDVTALKLQLEVNNQATTYSAYNGTTYNIPFGQTVYGGSGNALTGEFSVTEGHLTINSAILKSNNAFRVSGTVADMLVTNTDSELPDNDFLCDSLVFNTTNNVVFNNVEGIAVSRTSGGLWIYMNAIKDMTVEQATTYLASNPINVIYPLITPTSLSLTGVNPKTLYGDNNIYADTGDIDITYYTNKSNDILEFIDSEIGKKNGTNIPIEENSQDSIKTYVDNGLSGKADTSDTYTKSEVDAKVPKYFDLTANVQTADSGIAPFSYYAQPKKTDANIHQILSITVIDTAFNNPTMAVFYSVTDTTYKFMVYSARTGNVKIRVVYI